MTYDILWKAFAVFLAYRLLSHLFDLSKREEEFRNQKLDLDYEKTSFSLEKSNFEESMRKANFDLAEKRADLNNEVRLRSVALAKDIASREYLLSTPAFRALQETPDDHLYSRLLSSLSADLKITSPFDISAHIVSSSGEVYSTSLFRCSCPDYSYRRLPCKHMLRLAVEVGFILGFDKQILHSEISDNLRQREALLHELSDLRSSIQSENAALLDLKQEAADLQRLLASKKQNYSWLSQQFSDLQTMRDMVWVSYLRTKKRPAGQKAEEVKKIVTSDLRYWRALAKQNEYQLNFYESLFPWLLDFKEVPPLEAIEYVDSASNASGDEITLFRKYLSPEEYSKLSPSERNQLALDRWKVRDRTDWEAGIDYERYICYLYERDGYKVESNGATHGLEDMGRDLIAKKHGETLVIQCKRWSQSKTIHEKHIFQLYGTTVLLSLESPKRTRGVFVTTTSLSDVARRCADYLGISVIENRPLEDYPLIKCNISKDGERIYHLPFDQQYDRVQIDFSSGEFYAATVKEAEDAGFRHAYRWHSNDAE